MTTFSEILRADEPKPRVRSAGRTGRGAYRRDSGRVKFGVRIVQLRHPKAVVLWKGSAAPPDTTVRGMWINHKLEGRDRRQKNRATVHVQQLKASSKSDRLLSLASFLVSGTVCQVE